MKQGTFYILMDFPQPWPLQRSRSLCEISKEEWRGEVSADALGRLTVVLESAESESRDVTFQPIHFVGNGRAIACVGVTWTEEGIILYVNGEALLLYGGADTPVFEVVRSSSPLPKSRARLYPPLTDANYSTDDERLFLAEIDFIDSALVAPTWHNVRLITGRLRLLLLDGTPLVNKVNRRYKLGLQFEVIDSSGPLPEVFDQIAQRSWTINPCVAPNAPTVLLSLQELLSQPCLTSGTVNASVKDFIKACANSLGGVHSGKARDAGQKAVLDLNNTMRILGQEAIQQAIEDTSEIVLRGLGPLVEAVTSSASRN